MKRGPKPYSQDSDKLMPVQVIAKKLGVSVRTVNYDLKHAYNRLRFAFCIYRLATTEVR